MTSALTLTLQALIALGGTVVVVQSYRGYVRNGSRPLAFFGLGIGLIAVGSPVLTIAISTFSPVAGLFELLLLVRVVGLLALLYAFTHS